MNDYETYHNIQGKTVKLLKGVGMDDHATFVLYWIEEGWDGKFYAKSQIFMYKKQNFMDMNKMVVYNKLHADLEGGGKTSDHTDEDEKIPA
jgi:hypothetical protein